MLAKRALRLPLAVAAVWVHASAGAAASWTGRGIGTYGDTDGSPSLPLQLETASRLVGPRGWVVLFLMPSAGIHADHLLPNRTEVEAFSETLRLAYSHSLRVVVRLGWAGDMVESADAGSNGTAFGAVGSELAALVASLPLPPAALGPLLVHAGNELNACNEWRCAAPAGLVKDLATRAREVGGFMASAMTSLSQIPAARNGSVWLAHASIANWQTDGCECGTNAAVGEGRVGAIFLERLVAARPSLYADARWIST